MSADRARRTVLVVSVGAAAALVLAGTPSLAATAPTRHVSASGPLQDLSLATSDPTDGASAAVVATADAQGGTAVVLQVRGLQRRPDRPVLGAHVHTGPCVAGDGAAAGPHWRTALTAPVSDRTEVWLDISVTPGGTGTASARVPFHIPQGSARSVVIHEHPTASTGVAGGRLACLSVPF